MICLGDHLGIVWDFVVIIRLDLLYIYIYISMLHIVGPLSCSLLKRPGPRPTINGLRPGVVPRGRYHYDRRRRNVTQEALAKLDKPYVRKRTAVKHICRN